MRVGMILNDPMNRFVSRIAVIFKKTRICRGMDQRKRILLRTWCSCVLVFRFRRDGFTLNQQIGTFDLLLLSGGGEDGSVDCDLYRVLVMIQIQFKIFITFF